MYFYFIVCLYNSSRVIALRKKCIAYLIIVRIGSKYADLVRVPIKLCSSSF